MLTNVKTDELFRESPTGFQKWTFLKMSKIEKSFSKFM
jgi:hypothetical protein